MPHEAQFIYPNTAMQSRRMALAEAATNVAVSFVFAILVACIGCLRRLQTKAGASSVVAT